MHVCAYRYIVRGCTCECTYVCAHMYLWRPEMIVETHEARVTGGFELLGMATGKQALVLCKSSKHC